jgi:putative ABC transport system permease protein
VLTLFCITIAFVLFGALHGVTAAIDGIIDVMSETRLRIMSRVNITQPLPLAHLARISTVPGVEAVSYYNFFAGYYQEPGNGVQVGAIDPETLDAIYPEMQLDAKYIEAMKHTRNGALVGVDLAAERGWKIGDRIPLGSAVWTRKDGAKAWEFEIVGTYGSPSGRMPTSELWVNYEYFDEARAQANGTVTLYFVKIGDATRAAATSEAIDALFANSMNETQTQNEKDWVRAQVAQIGDMGFFVNAIIVAVMFTLLFLTGNTMAQSVRERIPELAVLKTYGFSNGAVVSLVFGEALLLCAVAAGIGLTIASLIAPVIYREIGAGGIALPWSVFAVGFAISAGVAVISAVPAAWRVQRLSIVDALAGR